MREVWRDAAWATLLAFVSACLIATPIWENGDIEAKWWAVKAWSDFQFPDFPVNHHNLRWGINFPAIAWVRLFSDGALSYLLLTHFVFALTSGGLYALTRQLTTPLIAALMFGVWLINPIAYYLPSNLMPEIYSVVYPVAALLLVRNAYATNSRWSFAWAVVMMFFAYGAKETNIFFMPGWGLYELLRRRWANVALIIGVFGGCLLVETVTVNVLLSDRSLLLGRPQAILDAGHLDDMSAIYLYNPIDLITRWGFHAATKLDMLEFFNKAIYWAFFIASGWKAWTWIRARTLLPPPGAIGPSAAPGGEAVSIAWAMGLSFAFCSTFFIVSLQPFILGQPLNDRYLWPLIVPACVVLSVVLRVWLDRTSNAKAGFLGMVAGFQRLGTSVVQGRHFVVALLIVAALGTLARWPIEIGETQIRRNGFAQPYTVFDVQRYFDNARSQVLQGCTIVFSRRRPAQALLMQAFRFQEIGDPALELYMERAWIDGLTITGRRLRAWEIPRADYGALWDRLYSDTTDPLHVSAFRPFALRLEGGDCDRTYYYGAMDVNPRDQPVAARLQDPPPLGAP